MKKVTFWGLLLFFALFQFSCDEIGPNIDLGSGSSTKKVLIEEFTGVRCVNCPEGSEVIENLVDIYGNQLIPISIHSGFFSEPYPESNYDFRTDEGEEISTLLGTASAWPAASVNRTIFEGATDFIVGKNSWPGYIAQALAEAPLVEIEISKSFNEGTRLLEITTNLDFAESISDPLLISVMITENNIVDVQLTPDGKDANYSHKHVLRAVVTDASGDSYTGGTNAGDTGSKSFSFTLPSNWVESNCEIVAFVHSGTTKEVFQANSAHVVD